MFRIAPKFAGPADPSARRGAARLPRRALIGLEALEDRRVPAALSASAAITMHFPPTPVMPALAVHYPPTPVMPALAAHYPPNPIMPALAAHWPPSPIMPALAAHYPPDPV